jgi:mRNA interferase MazF
MTTPPTTSFKHGDIVLLPFLFSDLQQVKRRPGLVVSSGWYHDRRQEVIIAAITSNVARRPLPGDVLITDWKAAGLLKPSVVTGILQTFKHALILQNLGSLSGRDLKTFKDELALALDLNITGLTPTPDP